MSQKKNYSRYFIILQEEQKGYAIASDKLPSGYVKMEAKNGKCKLSYYAQNLKKEPTPYYMMLICDKKEVKKVLKLGELNIDDNGRADIMFEFQTENLADTGIAMDKISGAAIVKVLDTNIIPVMTGFSTTEIPDWKGFPLIDPKNRNSEAIPKKEANTSIFDEYEKAIEVAKEHEDNKRECNEAESIEEKQLVKAESIEEKQLVKKEQRVEKSEIVEEPVKTEVEAKVEAREFRDDEWKYERERVGDFFNIIVDEFEEINHFCKDIKRCKWYKIPIDKVQDMYSANYNKHLVVYLPMINYYPYIKKYGHYLMGLKCNKKGRVKYLVYAIPGNRCKEEQPLGGESGFVTWVPLKQEDEKGMGYWLMFYDFMSSTVLIPSSKNR